MNMVTSLGFNFQFKPRAGHFDNSHSLNLKAIYSKSELGNKLVIKIRCTFIGTHSCLKVHIDT